MRLLLLTFILILPFSAQAQKKLKEGKFFYDIYQVDGEGNREDIGKAVLLQLGSQQRFEIVLNGLIGAKADRLQVLLNTEKNTLQYFVYNDKQQLEDQRSGDLDALKKQVTKAMTDQLTLNKSKDKESIVGYTTEKYTFSNEGLDVSWDIYHTNKIQIPEHGLYFTLLPVEGANFPLKAVLNIPGKKEKLFIQIHSFTEERPDSIWFDLDRLPIYPFEAVNKKKENSSINNLTDLLWHSTTSEQEALRAYHSALSNSLIDQQSNFTNKLQTLSDKREAILENLSGLLDDIKFYQVPDESYYMAKILKEEEITLLEDHFKSFIDIIHETLKPFIEKPSQLNELYEKLLALQPKEQFGSAIEAYQALTGKQAIALLRSYQNLALLMEIEGLQALAKATKAPFKTNLSNEYRVTSFSRKPYILLGQTYEAEIGVAQTIDPKEAEVSVNGRRLVYENGKATFRATPRSLGEQNYTTTVTFTHPETGEEKTIQQELSYEVGVATATAAADKMNVFYVGVDNPISVAAAGISSKDIRVTVSGGGATIEQVTRGKYNIRATKPSSAGNPCKIIIRDISRNRIIASFPFRVKRIPNPVAKLTNNKRGGSIKAEEMRAQRGLMAILENFDFDAKCMIHSFDLQTVKNGELSQPIRVQGGAFKDAALSSIQSAASGDVYLFQNIKARCPGDTAGRKIGSMNFVLR